MKLLGHILILVLIELSLTLGVVSGWAQDIVNSVSSNPEITENLEKNTEKPILVLLSVSTASNLISTASDEAGQDRSTNIEVRPTFKISEDLSVGATLGLIKSHVGEETLEAINTKFALAYKETPILSWLSTHPSTFVRFPTNETSRKRDRLQVSAGVENTLTARSHIFGLTNSNSYGFSVQKNSHEFDRNAEGTANIEYQLQHAISENLSIHKNITLGLGALFVQQRTYHQHWIERYEFSQEMAYEFQNNLVAKMGHQTGGALFKANGKDSNLELYNGYTSLFYLGLDYLF